MRYVLMAVALGWMAPAWAGDMPTCQDVIEAKDAAAMKDEVATYRKVALKSAALQRAQALHTGLTGGGVKNALQLVLESYESTFMPVREISERAWEELEVQHGGMSNAFSKLCPARDTEVIDFYRQFYGVMLDQFQDYQQTKPNPNTP